MSLFQFIDRFDRGVIRLCSVSHSPLARIGLFVIFFWFGFLKVIGVSSAGPLVQALFERTIPFMPFDTFMVGFGIYEMVIGVAFLVPRWERFAIFLLVPHMFTTFMPLVLLPQVTWDGFLVPSLEGQYIVKNLIIIALALGIGARLTPLGGYGRHK